MNAMNNNESNYLSINNGAVRIITLHDTEPVTIKEEHSVIDDLKLKKVRQKMDAAHNDMIRKKYQLALYKEVPGLYDKADNRSPYDQIFNPLPERPSANQIQYLIDTLSFRDNEYRKTAKEYLDKVIPAAEAETKRLQREVDDAILEYNSLVAAQREKIRAAQQKLNAFNNGIHKEVLKFETAPEGSRTPDKCRITSADCESVFPSGRFHSRNWEEDYKDLKEIQEKLESIEAESVSTPDREESLALIRAGYAESVTGMKDTSYTTGAAVDSAKGTGLKDLISNIFS